MSKFTKVRRKNPSPTMITPGYRETGDIMTIEDEVKTITVVNDGTNEDEIIDPGLLCDQRLEVPGDNSSSSLESKFITTLSPSALSSDNSFSEKLRVPLGIETIGPTSAYMIEFFRKGFDIHNEEDRRCLTQRLESSNNDIERVSIEAYIRIFETKQCEYCNYSCKDRDSIKRHVSNVHLKEKPFPCDECEASFGRKDKLKRHKQCLHSDERPYSCDFCDYSCKRQDKLRLHTHRIHYKNAYKLQRPSFKPRRKSSPVSVVTFSQSSLSKSSSLNSTL